VTQRAACSCRAAMGVAAVRGGAGLHGCGGVRLWYGRGRAPAGPGPGRNAAVIRAGVSALRDAGTGLPGTHPRRSRIPAGRCRGSSRRAGRSRRTAAAWVFRGHRAGGGAMTAMTTRRGAVVRAGRTPPCAVGLVINLIIR
jgi:hypothetical protein